ncbi:MAG TPA: apolipoprotein N-acyltransferase [Acidimicrobiia bacterium]|nr:apolipoprotein N-acyltransferase [Acidimicrobiia bacterium]
MPTSSSASRASSSSRSDVSPTRTGSSATTAPEVAPPAPPGPAPEAPASRPSWFRARTAIWKRLTLALGAGILAGFCFPPYDLGPVIVVALAGLLWTWRGARARHAALYGFAFGVGCYGVVLEWARYFGTVAIVPFVGTMAAYVALAGAVVALLAARRVSSPWLTAAIWVVMEGCRGRFPVGGFAWADNGIALHDLAAARAVASFGGVPLVSFVCVAAAGFLLDLAIALRAGASRSRVLAVAGLAGMIAIALLANVARYQPTETGHLRVAMLQGDDRELSLAGQQRQLLTGAHLALAARLRGHYDLIVFPESALDTDPQLDPDLRGHLTALAREHSSSILVNARTPAGDDEEYNSNILYGPDGRYEGTYSKQHLVPFGEYVPWREELGFIGQLREIPYDFKAGNGTKIFRVAGHPIGTVICFESAFAPLVREYVRQGAQAIVVSTSNRSYHRSGNAEQHLANSQMRAAETARPVLQAAVSGISAVIDPDGTVHDTTKLFQQDIVTASIATTTGETPFVRLGDWIVYVSALGVAVAAVVAVRRRGARARP